MDVGPLQKDLKKSDPKARIRASNELAKIGFEARAALKQLKQISENDGNTAVRRAATAAIKTITDDMRKKKFREHEIKHALGEPIDAKGL
ncbi:MAG: hypothetical protein IIA67_11135 [Planctomycetes bacterium]|nr:hypothetical protein [Planctomycetota bacterium]